MSMSEGKPEAKPAGRKSGRACGGPRRCRLGRSAALVVLAGTLASATLPAAEHPGLGQVLGEDQVAAVDFTILPDGTGLPAGQGGVEEGRTLYEQWCRACHGEAGKGGPNDRLVGGVGSLASDAPVKTIGSYWPYATTVFDYIRRAMPYTAPGSLSADDVYALTAYLLHENGIVGEDAVMDADALPAVVMPNREGFVWVVGGEVGSGRETVGVRNQKSALRGM